MTWSVYKHISPSNKVYIGISSNISRRWASKGYYYHLSDTVFSRALKKYGWDNFQHVILAKGLTKEDAIVLEKELISLYKELKRSYNTTDGGEGYIGKHSETHIKNRIKSRISKNTTIVLVIDKEFNYLIFNSKSETGMALGVKLNVITHVLLQPLGYTCKGYYLYEHSKALPINIELIKSLILTALQQRKELTRQHKLKQRNYD